MIYGCCVSMLSRNSDKTGIENIGLLSDAGYDYVELPLAQMMQLSDEDFEKLYGSVQASGMKCRSCNNFVPASIRLTGPAVDRDAYMQYAEKAIGKAAALGAETIVFGSSGAKNVPVGFSWDAAWKQVTAFLRDIDGLLKKAGITVVIEPLMKLESNIVNTVTEGLQLAREVDRENIKLLVDYYHFSVNREEYRAIEEAGSFIKHVHFARPLGRAFPQGPDEDGYKSFFRTLSKIGYSGKVSFEAYSNNPEYDLKNGLALLKAFAS